MGRTLHGGAGIMALERGCFPAGSMVGAYSRRTRELRSALPAAAPCELCRYWVGKPGDVGKQLLSPCSPKGPTQVQCHAVCPCLLHRLQELVFQTEWSSQVVHRHLCFPTFLAIGVWKSVGTLALTRATMNFISFWKSTFT